METLPLVSAVPHGFCHPHQQAFEDVDTINPLFLQLRPDEGTTMTKNHGATPGFIRPQPYLDQSSWHLDTSVGSQSLSPTHCLPPSGSEATRSPGRNSHQQSSGISEDTGSPFSVVYTPSSTHDQDLFPLDDGFERTLDNEDDLSRSPLSESMFSSATDSSFLKVNYAHSGQSIPTRQQMSLPNFRPQVSSSGGSAHPSRASSVAKSSTPNHAAATHWSASLPVFDPMMDHDTSHISANGFGPSDGLAFGGGAFHSHDDHLQYELMQNTAIPDEGRTNDFNNVTHNPFRTFDNGTQQMLNNFEYATGSQFPQTVPSAKQLREPQQWFSNSYEQSQALFPQHTSMQSVPVSAHNPGPRYIPANPLVQVDQFTAMSSPASEMGSLSNIPMRPQQSNVVIHQPSPSSRASPYPRPYKSYHSQISGHHGPSQRHGPHVLHSHKPPTAPSRRLQPGPRRDSRNEVPSNARPASPQNGKRQRGGRKKNTHLVPEARQRTSIMRKKRACWNCALQRDQVRFACIRSSASPGTRLTAAVRLRRHL